MPNRHAPASLIWAVTTFFNIKFEVLFLKFARRTRCGVLVPLLVGSKFKSGYLSGTYLWSLLSGLWEGPSFKIRCFLSLSDTGAQRYTMLTPKHPNFGPTPERCYLYERTVNSCGLKVCHRGPQVSYLKTQKYEFLTILCQIFGLKVGIFLGLPGCILNESRHRPKIDLKQPLQSLQICKKSISRQNAEKSAISASLQQLDFGRNAEADPPPRGR